MASMKPNKTSSTHRKEKLTQERTDKSIKLAHDLKEVDTLRTQDILTADDVEFKNLLLPEFILHGLTAANFHRPSPIQLRSIPLLRLGLDLIVQSKAGTGKTLVITLAVLETVNLQSKRLQVIVVAPTREIALQTKHFISIISSDVAVKTVVFIGGTSVKEDRKNLLGCQVAIGTPGRLNSLIESGDMSLCHVRLFVLDEADKLMEKSIFPQVKSISKLLPVNKQTILCSATFLNPVKEYVIKHMKEPFWVTPDGASRLQPGNFEQQRSSQTVLLGVTQFFKEVPSHSQIVRKLKFKLEEILEILSGHPFTQCIIFSNYQTRAETICHQLVSNGWPAISVRGQDEQSHRTATLTSFKEFQSRVLLTTDVMSRGVDFRGVDLVINLDIPYDSATYLHRMGRAGRFGSYGCVITLASKGEEVEAFKKILYEINNTTVYTLPDDLSLIKETGKLTEIFFGPQESALNKCHLGQEEEVNRHNLSNSSDQEDHKIPSSNDIKEQLADTDIICGKETCAEFKANVNEETVRREISQDVKDSTVIKGLGGPFQKLFDKIGEKSNVPTSRRDGVVQHASAQLSEVLCMPNCREGRKFCSFEELAKTYSDWMDSNDSCNVEGVSSAKDEKNPEWWSSANILLTAAKLQLQELKERAVARPVHSQHAEDLSSDSSQKESGEKDQEDAVMKTCRKKTKKKQKKFSHQKQQKGQTSPPHKVSESSDVRGSTWLWDESSKLYYYWDSSFSCYHLYNPDLESYFKWELGSDRYFKWDPLIHQYRLWDCASNCYLDTKEPKFKATNSTAFPSNSTKPSKARCDSQNQNYVQWFSLWNKHVRQMTWQVYQAEYLKHLCEKFHNL
ncbi:putative ATP-dependent RNA helicase DDX20 [Frankliniella fusca]|uniref:RNA helicase n=1 Tax=Frankliniella fusca TaxID=407009 RepID=A0AAE1H182_9NEOP|nr:putative ATP-dependent RNA helicase DDX20 [Frankliniella fusca]